VVMGLKLACGIDPGIETHRFHEISRFVGTASGRPVPDWKPVVGKKVFSHESGVHADGVLKNPANYEGFDPAQVGLSRYLVLGKHSGTSSLLERFRELGIALSREEAARLMERVREKSQEIRRPLKDRELRRLYRVSSLPLVTPLDRVACCDVS